MEKNFLIVLSLCLCIHFAAGLHLQATNQTELSALLEQQKKFEGAFSTLLNNVSKIENELAGSNNTDQKIMILENAIISERESVFELSKIIIPPFNISKNSCEKMTDQQKVELLGELEEARIQVNALKNMTNTMPACDQIDQIKRDIEKEIFFLNSIESIIYTNCSMNVVLSPTIWQSNIYAPNWVLGQLSIDDLIEQYYQRSIRYDNVTNCPIETPFYDGTKCLICRPPTPIFDIYQKKCIACPNGTNINDVQRACVKIPFFTDYKNLTATNFSPKDGPFPQATKDSLPCPQATPYYNSNATCIACKLPQYFDVVAQKCKNCSQGQIFDKTQQECTVFQPSKVTNLFGTNWTSQKPVKTVLQQRLDLLNTPGNHFEDCTAETPYYDGVACISCPKQFNLETKLCVDAPNGTVFDPNTHKYEKTTPLTNSLPNTTNPFIGTPPTNDPAIKTCNASTPFYDGIACIACPEPFIIFDYSTKTCVLCNPEDVYNNNTHACEHRPSIFVSEREDRLMATPKVSIDNYHDDITNMISKNPNAMVINCDSPSEYSNYTNCLNCSSTEYFNVETLKCQTCNGTYNSTTQLCQLQSYVFTNLTAPNIVNLPANVTQEQAVMDNEIKRNNQSYICPAATPFAINETCVACDPAKGQYFFDYKASQCQGCPNGTLYSLNSTTGKGQCVSTPKVSNAAAILAGKDYIASPPNFTESVFSAKQDALKKQNKTYETCPAEKPYFNQTSKVCQVLCPQANSFYDIQTQKCVACLNFNVTTQKCDPLPLVTDTQTIVGQPNYIVTPPNATAETFKARENNFTQAGTAFQRCPTATPFFNVTSQQCQVLCPTTNTYYDISSGKCIVCAKYEPTTQTCQGPKFPNLTNSNWIVNDNNTMKVVTWRNGLEKVDGSIECPAEAPYYNNQSCVSCPPNTYFNYDSFQCQQCNPPLAFDINLHACITQSDPGQYQTSLASPNLLYGGYPYNQWQDTYNQNKASNPKIADCPAAQPYFDGVNCIMCPSYLPYFSLSLRTCQNCPDTAPYNSNLKDCMSNNTIIKTYPNIPKMYANIF